MKTNLETTNVCLTETDTSRATALAPGSSPRTFLPAEHPGDQKHPLINTYGGAPYANGISSQISGAALDTNVFEVIKQRRSVGQMTHEQPTRAQIERLLEAATYAPSHHVTEPWHFFVLTGAARDRLGEVMEESLRQRLPELGTPQAQEQLWRERTKPRRAPVIIIVALRDALHLAGELVENIEAAAAAVQNMLLVATEMGLATIWRTGDPACDPLVTQWFGLDPSDHIVAFVYVGYPKVTRAMRIPTHFSKKTTWLS